jgi:hypothetical protein
MSDVVLMALLLALAAGGIVKVIPNSSRLLDVSGSAHPGDIIKREIDPESEREIERGRNFLTDYHFSHSF